MAEPIDIVAAKKALRSSAKAVRAAAFRQHGASAAERIAGYGLSFADPAPGAVVSAFSAIGEEIDPVPLLMRLHAEGHALCLPVMQGKGKPLLFRRWRPGDEMGEAVWGIREPLPSAPEMVPDIVLTALLAFDRQGYRLGYGGGFYDRTLAAVRAQKQVTAIGIAYDEQRVDAVPHLDYDERLDWVLTPSGPLRCSGR